MIHEYISNSTSPCSVYFTSFLPQFLNSSLLEDVDYLTCVFSCQITDQPDEIWDMKIESGLLVQISPHSTGAACGYVCDSATFFLIVGAVISPQDAFFDLRVDIVGDIELALKLSAIMETFFVRYPYLT